MHGRVGWRGADSQILSLHQRSPRLRGWTPMGTSPWCRLETFRGTSIRPILPPSSATYRACYTSSAVATLSNTWSTTLSLLRKCYQTHSLCHANTCYTWKRLLPLYFNMFNMFCFYISALKNVWYVSFQMINFRMDCEKPNSNHISCTETCEVSCVLYLKLYNQVYFIMQR